MDFIKQYLGTLLVLLIVISVIFMIIKITLKDKKNGKNSCGCNCRGCANSSICHSKKKN